MVVNPRPYYVCDYCMKRSDYGNFKYTDNSGLNNKCYDMCSDKCYEKHKEFLIRIYNEKPKYMMDFDLSGTVEDHIKDFMFINTIKS